MNHLTWDPTPFFTVLGSYVPLALIAIMAWVMASVGLIVYLGYERD